MKLVLPALLFAAANMNADEIPPSAATAVGAVNALGVELLQRAGQPNANFLLSPYSIQSALAMTYAGAEGATREEMARVLHFPKGDAELDRSFAALHQKLEDLMQRSAESARQERRHGATNDPVLLTAANRLFGQAGYDFRPAFLELVRDNYGAPFKPLDFARDAAGATKQINDWVEQRTRERIRNLIPAGALGALTRLVLVNAIYLKAPWEEEFREQATQPRAFRTRGSDTVDVPTMTGEFHLGYAKRDGFTAVAVPYRGAELQFLILLPDNVDGLAALESRLTARMLTDCTRLSGSDVILFLPKFKLEPPLFRLGQELQKLGMKTAFDQPPGSANFDRMAPRRENDYLYISEVFHKTFLKLDEKGTEAAAATAVAVAVAGIALEKPKPIEVKVDHPFIFAIQHRPSGACLFLGHVVDPR